MARGNAVLGRVAHDPALLAFIKCHLTSVPRWNALRVLARFEGEWCDAPTLARALTMPPEAVETILDGLAEDGILQRRETVAGAAYRLDSDEPSGRVVLRLIRAAVHNDDLRRVIVGQMVRSSDSAAGATPPSPDRPVAPAGGA